jgi:hypothetical protein
MRIPVKHRFVKLASPGAALAPLIAVTALLAFAASPALAQRGGQRGMGDAGGRAGSDITLADNSLPKLSTKDIQKFDPIKVILDKKKDLKLDDPQRTSLGDLENEVQWNIKRLSARIDSTQKAMHPKEPLGAADDSPYNGSGRGGRGARGGGNSSAEDAPPETPEVRRQRLLDGRKIIGEAVVDLQREHDSACVHALAVLNDAQRSAANVLLKKRDDELAKLLKDSGFAPTSSVAKQ